MLMSQIKCSDYPTESNFFQIVVLEKSLGSPLDSKEIKLVNPKGNQLWIFIGKTEAESPIIWLHDVKSQVLGKHPDAGEDWGQEEKGTTVDEMVGWHHWLNGHEFGKLWELMMDREAWHAVVHGVAKSWTQPSDWTELNYNKEGRLGKIYKQLLCIKVLRFMNKFKNEAMMSLLYWYSMSICTL